MRIRSVISFLAAAALAATLAAQQSFTGGTYTQNFNGLPSSGTFTLSGNGPHALSSVPINATGMTGWSLAKYSGSGANALFFVGTGSSNTGGVFSFGATSSASDRALGSLASGTTISRVGLALVNDTDGTIMAFTLSYTGEQWRRGDQATGNKFTFSYAVGGTDINTGTFSNMGIYVTQPTTTYWAISAVSPHTYHNPQW